MRTDVARWLHRRTFRALDYDPHDLLRHERREALTVSVVLPALDEERTVGARVRGPAR
jgi:glucosyl-3-phosphoglycerate synthase